MLQAVPIRRATMRLTRRNRVMDGSYVMPCATAATLERHETRMADAEVKLRATYPILAYNDLFTVPVIELGQSSTGNVYRYVVFDPCASMPPLRRRSDTNVFLNAAAVINSLMARFPKHTLVRVRSRRQVRDKSIQHASASLENLTPSTLERWAW